MPPDKRMPSSSPVVSRVRKKDRRRQSGCLGKSKKPARSGLLKSCTQAGSRHGSANPGTYSVFGFDQAAGRHLCEAESPTG